MKRCSNSSRPGAFGRPPGSICSPSRRLSRSSTAPIVEPDRHNVNAGQIGTTAYSCSVRLRYAFAAIALASAIGLAARAGVEGTPEGPAPPALLLGVSEERRLVRVDPVSLRELPGRGLPLSAPLDAWALSPDGSRLAGASERTPMLHLMDVERMRTLGALRTRTRGSPVAVFW